MAVKQEMHSCGRRMGGWKTGQMCGHLLWIAPTWWWMGLMAGVMKIVVKAKMAVKGVGDDSHPSLMHYLVLARTSRTSTLPC